MSWRDQTEREASAERSEPATPKLVWRRERRRVRSRFSRSSMSTVNSFGVRTPLAAGGRSVQMYSLPTLQEAGFPGIARLPYSMKILLENLLRHEDGRAVRAA